MINSKRLFRIAISILVATTTLFPSVVSAAHDGT
jgi:hypothetical protein